MTLTVPAAPAALLPPWASPAARPDPVPAPAGAVRLLLVDDEPTIRLALAKFLRTRGYAVEVAGSGHEALTLLAAGPFEAMLCDVRMPGMSGVELVPHAIAACPDLAVVMLTAVNDAATATQALTSGASDYVTKPVELGDLHQVVQRALARRTAAVERKAVERRIRDEVAARTAELEHEKGTLRQLTVSIVETLINAQEAKDVYLRGHSQRVADLGAQVAAQLGLDDDTVEDVRLAGRLHDVGKIGIREEVLNKPGRLTPEEYEHVKDHVRMGTEILAPLRHIIGPALQYVQDHHEHWGGGGYPRGIAGEEISLGGRILCACDAFDALTSRRPYREPLSRAATLDFLAGEAGRQVEPAVVEALRAAVERDRTLVYLDLHE